MQNTPVTVGDNRIDIIELVQTLWAGRWLIVAITSVFALGGVAYALLATSWYRAEIVVIAANDPATQSGLAPLGGFSSLASLAGINIGAGGASQKPIAVLKSRDFARDFIQDRQLLTILFADKWDSRTAKWKNQNPIEQPDIRDAVEFFSENVRAVVEDKKTGLLTLSVTWTDASTAAEWANLLVKRVNDRLRGQALAEAERNIKYLQGEMASTNVTSLQQSIGRVLELEMQKLLMARGSEEFAFKVVDQAVTPKERVKPRRLLVAFFSSLLGGILSASIVLVRKNLVRYRD